MSYSSSTPNNCNCVVFTYSSLCIHTYVYSNSRSYNVHVHVAVVYSYVYSSFMLLLLSLYYFIDYVSHTLYTYTHYTHTHTHYTHTHTHYTHTHTHYTHTHTHYTHTHYTHTHTHTLYTDATVELPISSKLCVRHSNEQRVLRLFILAKARETHQLFIISRYHTMNMPKLTVTFCTGGGGVRVGEEMRVQVTYRNILPSSLSHALFTIEGLGIHKEISYRYVWSGYSY